MNPVTQQPEETPAILIESVPLHCPLVLGQYECRSIVWAAKTKDHRLGGLNTSVRVSQSWSLEVQDLVSGGESA